MTQLMLRVIAAVRTEGADVGGFVVHHHLHTSKPAVPVTKLHCHFMRCIQKLDRLGEMIM